MLDDGKKERETDILSEGNGQSEQSATGSFAKLKGPDIIWGPCSALVMIAPREEVKVT